MYAVGMCVDQHYLLPALVALGSIAETMPAPSRREAAVRILTTDLSRQDAALMADFARHAGFQSFALAYAEPPRAAVMADTDYITITAYLRFQFTPRFLDRPYLIYVDADTLAVDDLTSPLENLRPGALGVVADAFNPAIGRGHALPGLVHDRPDLEDKPYYNAGMWWLTSDTLTAVHNGTLRALARGARYIHHNDQDALNLWLLDSGAAQPLPGRFNAFELGRFLERSDWPRRYTSRRTDTTDTALLHFVGSAKPWLTSCPTTEGVRLYRAQLRRTLRCLDRLGGHRLTAARPRRRAA